MWKKLCAIGGLCILAVACAENSQNHPDSAEDTDEALLTDSFDPENVTAFTKDWSEQMSDNIPRIIFAGQKVSRPVVDVWQDWSTANGQQAFFGPKVILELETNGLYEVHFLPEAEPGQRGHEDGRILGFQKERMLSFTWTMPPYMPEIRPHHTYVQVWFDEIDEENTYIRLFHQGFGVGEKWDAGYAYFEDVWPSVLTTYKEYAEQE